MELGVAVPYLEDEIKILLDYGLLKLMQNGRYQTNMFIYTKSCDEDIELKTKNLYKGMAKKLIDFIDKKYDEIKKLVFKDENVSQNKVRWFSSSIILFNSCVSGDKEWPALAKGGTGYLFGHNENHGEYMAKAKIKGVMGGLGSDYYSGSARAVNYKQLENCQVNICGQNRRDIDMLLGAAHGDLTRFTPDEIAQYLQWRFIEKDKDGDFYKPLFPVLTWDEEGRLFEIISDGIGEMRDVEVEALPVIINVMENHAPDAVKDQLENLAIIHDDFDAMANVIEDLCADGYLIIPTQHEFLTIYAVI